MSDFPRPTNAFTGDTNNIPVRPLTLVRTTYGPGPDDWVEGYVTDVGSQVSRASAVFIAGNTVTCDPGSGLDFSLIAGLNFVPLKLGWVNTHLENDGSGAVFTYTDHEEDLTMAGRHFDFTPTTTPPWDRQDSFRIWRRV